MEEVQVAGAIRERYLNTGSLPMASLGRLRHSRVRWIALCDGLLDLEAWPEDARPEELTACSLQGVICWGRATGGY